MVSIEDAQSMSVKSLQKTVERQYREILEHEQMATDFELDVTKSDEYHQMTEHWCRLTEVLRGKMDAHEYLHFMDELMAVTDADGTDSRGLPKRQPGRDELQQLAASTRVTRALKRMEKMLDEMERTNRLLQAEPHSDTPTYPDETAALQQVWEDLRTVRTSLKRRSDDRQEYFLSTEMHDILERKLNKDESQRELETEIERIVDEHEE